MEQKLVHKQYNSPIDLYSMNNIRKTIEAHSELIAPGVKGINFNKTDGSIKERSEVYKLIKEEEEERADKEHKQLPQSINISVGAKSLKKASSLSPISANHHQQAAFTKMPRTLTVQYSIEQPSSCFARQLQQQQNKSTLIKQQDVDANYKNVCKEIKNLGHPIGQEASELQLASQQGKFKCCECGQFISGPFAKIQNRFVHPHCFNCSTCGTSLKNSGYFVISDKLYCDIHAKQVANLMRLNYNFDANKQSNEQTTTTTTNQQLAQLNQTNTTSYYLPSSSSSSSSSLLKTQQPITVGQMPPTTRTTQNLGQTSATQNRPFYSTIRDGFYNRPDSNSSACTNQAATISTMFARRENSHNLEDRRQTKWTWKPTGPSETNSLTGGGDTTGATQGRSRLGSVMASEASGSATMKKTTDANSLSSNNTYHAPPRQELRESGGQMYSSSSSSFMSKKCNVNDTASLHISGASGRMPLCNHCKVAIQGPYILAGETIWCKPCSQSLFVCCNCNRSLLNIGFIETNYGKYFCEQCFDAHATPNCSRCNMKVKGYCLNALEKHWHPDCFVCGHCRQPFGNSSFYLEDNVPYCQDDWNMLFTTKCQHCSRPIGAGDKWIEALQQSYHADCFKCTSCGAKLEGSTFYCRGGRPFCRSHAC